MSYHSDRAEEAIHRTGDAAARAIALSILAVAEQLERIADAAEAARKDS